MERNNPLVDKLNQIARLNDRMGASMGGGGDGVPPQATGGTMLPPPPVAISPEEEAAAAQLYAEQWGHEPHITSDEELDADIGPLPRVALPRVYNHTPTEVEDFATIDLQSGEVVATNGARFAVPTGELPALRQFCFNVMLAAQSAKIIALAKKIGAELPQLQAMQGNEAPAPVQAPKQRKRKS